MTTSILRDTAEGTTVCTKCGTELMTGAEGLAHVLIHTEKPSSGQDKDSSALSGVSPGKGADTIIAEPGKPSMPWGLVMSQDHRYWFNGEGPRPSVTTVLEILSKPALVYWKGQEVARAIYRDSKGFFGESWEQGEDAAIKWAMGKADEQRDRAAKLGSSIHLLADMVQRAPQGAESDPTAFQVSEEEKPYLEAWRRFTAFLEASGASIVSSEHAVWGDGYAGTYDLIVQIPRADRPDHSSHVPIEDCTICKAAQELWLIDIKTSKGVYPEYALQLAAYGNAPSIILPNDPQLYPMPKIDRYAVLHLRPDQYPQDGYKLIEYPVTERDYYAFVSCLDMYEWRKEDRFNKSRL